MKELHKARLKLKVENLERPATGRVSSLKIGRRKTEEIRLSLFNTSTNNHISYRTKLNVASEVWGRKSQKMLEVSRPSDSVDVKGT
jgi:hypothetical protein